MQIACIAAAVRSMVDIHQDVDMKMPIGAAVRWLAERDPTRPAITCGDETVTREQLERGTNRLARAYAELGVGQDDLVTIGLPNSVAFYEAAIAAWKLGATPQPISSRLPARERAAIVALAEPALVIGVEEDMGAQHCLPAGHRPDPSLSDEPLEPDRVATALKAPTSGGSTGRPKIIVSGEPATVDPERPGAFGMSLGGVHLVTGPLYHNAPFAYSVQGLLTGNHLVVMPRFDAGEALRLMEARRVDWALLVPTMMTRIWRLPTEERLGRDLSSLNGILHLAAPCPPWLKEAWIDWLGPDRIWELYAGTERQGVTVISGQEWLEHRGSVGRPVGSDMQVRAPGGSVLATGETGELWMRSRRATPTYRYIGAEAERDDEGWETLGDLGWMDADGYVYIADRRADMILQGGANVYPAEVEAALEEHPAVLSCAVVGIADEDLGQRVHAVVQLATEVTDDELRSFLAERLVAYKIPRAYERVDRPVRDDAGKVRRSALTAMFDDRAR